MACSKLKVVGQILMKTKIDFILNGFASFFFLFFLSFFFFLGGGGGGEIARRQVSEIVTSILLVYCNALCDSLYMVFLPPSSKASFKSLKLNQK